MTGAGWGLGRRFGDLVFSGDRVSIEKGENFGRRMVVRAEQQCDCTYCYWTVPLNIVKIVHFILCDFYHNKKKTENKNSFKNFKKKKKRGDREIFHSVGKVRQALEEGYCSIRWWWGLNVSGRNELEAAEGGLPGAGHWGPCLSWNYKPKICCSKTLGPDVLLELEFSGF